MPTQTKTRRQAAAHKATATRKRGEAKRTAPATRRPDIAGYRVEELGRRAQRAFYIQVGAAARARERMVRAARTFTDLDRVTLEFDKLERRGARAVGRTMRTLSRRRRAVERDVQQAGRRLGRETDGLRADAAQLVERVKHLVR